MRSASICTSTFVGIGAHTRNVVMSISLSKGKAFPFTCTPHPLHYPPQETPPFPPPHRADGTRRENVPRAHTDAPREQGGEPFSSLPPVYRRGVPSAPHAGATAE